MSIRTAVITCAGYGTRFLPVTKTIQKEMLPILNRPVIDYSVADCIQAGITKIIFVVQENDRQVQEFYSEDKKLLAYLQRMHKEQLYEQVAHLHGQAEYEFVIQPDTGEYGTAVPLKLVEKYVQGEE